MRDLSAANRDPDLAAELVSHKVDIIVVAGDTEQVRAVKNATKTIPIVMIGYRLDPVEVGIVESLARPGGNVTGRPYKPETEDSAESGWSCSKKPFPKLPVSRFSTNRPVGPVQSR
jgi:ABC-type uncharacterized transport system substrate-binding protein